MNTVVSNVHTCAAKVRVKALAVGLSADVGARNSALAVRGFVARVGAVLAGFMVGVFFLMAANPPPAAGNIRIWGHGKKKGGKKYGTSKNPAL